MNVLDVTNLSKSFGSTCLFREISFALDETEKVGVIGRNGCGKSTLFRILAGLEDPDAGTIARKRGLTVAYLPQKPVLDPAATIRGVLEAYLGESRAKLRRHKELADEIAQAEGAAMAKLLDEQQEIHAWLDHHAAWSIGHRVDEICTRFAIPDPDARVGSLSGGWNQRVALAGILLQQPDLLLLDEPTNQIDAETVEWLEEHLRDYSGAVLMVTHDRYFLDRVVSRMFELDGGRLTAYTGGYSAYLEQKAARLAEEERGQARLMNLLRREEAWLRAGVKARTTKQKARIDRVEELRGQKIVAANQDISLGFSTEARLGGTILETSKLSAGIGGKVLVRDLDFSLRKGERVGILGPNGCGKTTLVRTLLGELPPAAGTVTIGKNTRVAYLDQVRSGLDETLSVEKNLGEDDWVNVGGPRGEKRHKTGYLEGFLFSRDDQRKPASTLSGGERARLLLARMLLLGANVLVLDEPTNDLDIPTLQILDEALNDFDGSVLMITHDRYFLDRVATGILHFEEGGRVVFYEGNYEMFTRLRAQKAVEEKPAEPVKPSPPRAQPKPRAGLSFKERKELEEVEGEIERLEARKAEVESFLADPARAAGGRQELGKLSEEFAGLEASLHKLMSRWEELESKR